MKHENDNANRPFFTKLPEQLITRIRLEAMREGVPIERLLTDRLDSVISHSRIIIDTPAKVKSA